MSTIGYKIVSELVDNIYMGDPFILELEIPDDAIIVKCTDNNTIPSTVYRTNKVIPIRYSVASIESRLYSNNPVFMSRFAKDPLFYNLNQITELKDINELNRNENIMLGSGINYFESCHDALVFLYTNDIFSRRRIII